MTDSIMYHDGNRRLQDRFDSRRISDRLEEKLTRVEFTSDDKAFIESVPYFFLATADAEGRPDCSYKGGMPGFVRVTGPSELAFPDYDGNGMFKSLGNVLVNPNVGMLFIAMHGKPQRLRVNGGTTVSDRDPLLVQTVGAQLIVRVAARAIFPNCPRYIPTMQLIEPANYAPRSGCETPEPAWKDFADFKNYVHPRQPTFKGSWHPHRGPMAGSGLAALAPLHRSRPTSAFLRPWTYREVRGRCGLSGTVFQRLAR